MQGTYMQVTAMPQYRTIRLRDEDFRKMKKVAKVLRRKGLDSIEWKELRKQDLIEVPDDEVDDDEESTDFTWGLLIGLGAAALAYFLLKGEKK